MSRLLCKYIEALNDYYIPEKLIGRNNEVENIRNSLIYIDQSPVHISIGGKPGTGKTVVVRVVCKKLIEEMTESNPGLKARFIEVNCMKKTEYSTVQEIARQLNTDGKWGSMGKIPWNYDIAMRYIIEEMDKLDAAILFLDEIDRMKDIQRNQGIIYDFVRMRSTGKTGCNISIIMATNKLLFYDTLDDRIASSLHSSKFIFDPYNADQIHQILEDRANIAMNEGTLDSGVIPYISAISAREHGDARLALGLLLASVRYAQGSGDSMVTEGHVRIAKKRLEYNMVKNAIRTLPLQQKIALYAISLLTKKKTGNGGKEKPTTGEIYEQYQYLCNLIGGVDKHVGDKQLTNYFKDFNLLQLTTHKVVSHGRGGRTTEVIMMKSPETIDSILMDDETLSEIIQSGGRRDTTLARYMG